MLNVIPKIEISFDEFKRKIKEHGTMKVAEELERLWYLTKDAAGYGWDNIEIKISNSFGECFATHIYQSPQGYITVTIWDERGHIALGTYEMTENGFADGEDRRMAKVMNNWTRGFMPCCGCGKEINYQEKKSQHYFAGVYCDECWESKYRELEANESYN